MAQSFRTGSNSSGYRLHRVGFLFAEPVSGRSTSVKIREDDNGEPGDPVATLMNPASFNASGLVGFTAPANTFLDADTTYWISVNEGVRVLMRMEYIVTALDGERGKTGWTIGNNLLARGSETADWDTSSYALKVQVEGGVRGAESTRPRLNDGQRRPQRRN